MPAYDWTYEKALVQLMRQFPEKQLFMHCCEYEPDNYWANQEFVRPQATREIVRIAKNVTALYELGDFTELMDPTVIHSQQWWAVGSQLRVRMHPWADYCGHPMTARIAHLKKFVHPGNLIAVTFDCQWRIHPAIPPELIAKDVYRIGVNGRREVDTLARAKNTHAFVSKQLRQANTTARVVTEINSGYKGHTVPMYSGAFSIK